MISSKDWRPADGLILEPNALVAATDVKRNLALTAGPGAGKTEMLAQRADFLLRTGCCRYPQRILAISFKVDASANLKDRVKRRCGTTLSGRLDSHTFHAFGKRIIDRFRVALSDRNSLDADYTIGTERIASKQITFNDIVPFATDILETSELARNALRQTYCDVFLDEFQDCTSHQYALIKLAFYNTKTRLTAVGDTKQKIMGWAGALEGIFSIFASDFNATPLNLYRNFRSQPQLLRMQNEVIRVLDPESVMPADLIKGSGGEILLKKFNSCQHEAEWVANAIVDWTSNDAVSFSEIAILISKQPELYADPLMSELTRRGIPFRNEQALQDLSVEPLTRLAVDYLLVLFSDRDPGAYTRLMALLLGSDAEGSGEDRREWNRFLSQERARADSCTGEFVHVWSFVTSFLKEMGRERLIALSVDYESIPRLREVLINTKTHLKTALAESGNVLAALCVLTTDPGVRILTIHKSKGLEFDTVVMIGIEEETFWGKSDDERCAFFVGISRAKKRLVLTFSEGRAIPKSNPKRWDERRTIHREFLGYVEPFI